MNKSIKNILVLNYEFPPLGGGAGNATYYLLKELANNPELQITLVTSSIDKYREEQFASNIKIYYLDIGKKGNIHYQSIKDLLTYPWQAFWLIKKINKKQSFDTTHAFFTVPCAFVAMLFNIPYIVGLRGSDVPFYSEKYYWLDTLFFQFLNKYIWSKAKYVIANSQGLKELALQTSPKQEIGVIYNGVDVEEFTPIPKNDNSLQIISTSRLTKRKGIKYLIEAVLKMAETKPNIHLKIVGGGDQEEELKQLVGSSRYSDKIEFLGALLHQDIARHCGVSDIFVLPSLNEGMSNSLLEAMSCGLAIVATDTGGTKELVDDSNGIIIEKNSSQSILQAFEILYKDKQLLNHMKVESRKKAESLSWKKMAEEYIQYYLKINTDELA